MKPRMSIILAVLVAAFALVSCTTSDPMITTKIKAKLVADETVRPYQIEVTTKNGVVTLTGNIDSADAKDRALQLVKETKGVTQVVDMISVKTASAEGNAPDPSRSLGERIDDATITMKVKSRLLDDPSVKGLKIDVDTRDGVVYLTGSVRSESEKDKAIELAKNTEGVRDVQANLTIKTS